MIALNSRKLTNRCLLVVGLSVCFLLQSGCTGQPPSALPALHYDVPCSPTEARTQLRQYFSSKQIRTSEAAPDSKAFAITTELISEPRSGKMDHQISYMVEIKSTDNANTTAVNLIRLNARSRGVRERDWHEDTDLGKTQSEEQISQQIQTICSSAKQ